MKLTQAFRSYRNRFFTLFLHVVFLGITSLSYAQTPVNIIDLDQLTSAELDAPADGSSFTLRDLTRGAVPSIIYSNGTKMAKNGANEAVRLIAEINSLSGIDFNDNDLNTVELVFIQVNNPADLSGTIDLDQLNLLDELKYIYLACSFELCSTPNDHICEEQRINDHIVGVSNDIHLVYTSQSNE